MPTYFYQILHLAGIIMIFMGFGALLARSLIDRYASEAHKKLKVWTLYQSAPCIGYAHQLALSIATKNDEK